MADYHDKRADFFRTVFGRGLGYEAYLETGSAKHAERWRNFESKLSFEARQKDLLSTFSRKMNVLCMSGIWCGDCARQGPMLRLIEQACPQIKLVFVDNKQEPELQEELRINGAEKVPVVVILSEDFFEIARFGDRQLSIYRKKVVTELGAACDPGLLPPPQQELAIEIEEWINTLERAQYLLRLSPMLRNRYND